MSGPADRTLYYGDCLDWMGRWAADSVDLIYLDPPFNSNTSYNVLYTDRGAGQAQYRAFDDTWTWNEAAQARLDSFDAGVARPAREAVLALSRLLGPSGMLAYVTYMAERLEHCERLLKPTGSIYLHCDPTASHCLRLVMDSIFGTAAAFRNEIVWKRTSGHSDAKRLGSVHDTILLYAGESATFNRQFAPYDPAYVAERFRREDPDGRRWMDDNLTAKGLRGGGYDYEYKGARSLWRVTEERMRELDAANRLHFTKTGGIRIKRYLDELEGVPLNDLWTDIPPINSQARERLGYPTQKPLKLLERIIRASSNPGDVVLDPFCGCGTTVDAANRLGRRWAGIDVSSFAVDLIRDRRMKDPDIRVEGIPFDLRSARRLAASNPFSFESWAIMRLPGFAPNTRQVADGGVDGRAALATPPSGSGSRLALAQVKSGKFGIGQLREFIHVINREGAALGVFVTLDPVTSPAARTEAAAAGTVVVGAERYPRCQLWSLAEHFEDRRPRLPTMADPYTGKPLLQSDLWG